MKGNDFMKPLHHPFFVKFIIYFNKNQDFFECHEVLEDYWKSIPNVTKDHPLTGYILLSTGMYHWRRGNTIGAHRTLEKAIERMTRLAEEYPGFSDGINFDELCENVNQAIEHIETGQSFASFPIEVTSPAIAALITKITPSMELLPFESDTVIHKHMLRDRSDIIRIRDEKKKGRLL